MMRKTFLAAAGMLLLMQQAKSQSFAGYHNSHYAGIYGVLTNPASAANSRYKWDVNIIGADARAGNTYMSMPKSVLFNMPDTLVRNQDYFLDTSASRRQFGWGIGEVLMPSVLYAIDENQSVAFTWRIRAAGNGGGTETQIANFFGLDYPNPRFTDRRFNMDYGGVYGQSWNEFGFTYARVIRDDGMQRIKAGVTLKYLSGIAAGYAVVKDVSFLMNSPQSAEITQGTLSIGYNEQVDSWESPPLSNFKLFENPGVGLDLGLIYDWRPDSDGFGSYESDSWNPDADEYKLRIGVSITDIGGIFYKKAPINADLDLTTKNINPDSLKFHKDESWQQYYRRVKDYFTPIAAGKDKFFMTSPTALHLMGDYNIDGRFFVNANVVIALTGGKADNSKTYAMTQLQITPRFDSRHFGAYLPLVLNRHGQVDAGVGLRIGPLVLGSASIFSNLLRQRVDHADAFIALRMVPIRFNRGNGEGGGLFRKRKQQLGCPY